MHLDLSEDRGAPTHGHFDKRWDDELWYPNPNPCAKTPENTAFFSFAPGFPGQTWFPSKSDNDPL